jgi:hypothetical protein
MFQTTNLFAIASRIIRNRCRGRFGRGAGPVLAFHTSSC